MCPLAGIRLLLSLSDPRDPNLSGPAARELLENVPSFRLCVDPSCRDSDLFLDIHGITQPWVQD